MKWVYLTTAPDQWTAEIWRTFLLEEGVPVLIETGDVTSFLGTSPFPVRLVVDSDRKEEAIELLSQQVQSESEEQPPS